MKDELKSIARELSLLNSKLNKLILMCQKNNKVITTLKNEVIDCNKGCECPTCNGIGSTGEYKQSEK